jgi:hypothetical protein
MKEKESCFNCINYKLCYFRHQIDSVLNKSPLCIDGIERPGKLLDVFNTIALACIEYQRKEEK